MKKYKVSEIRRFVNESKHEALLTAASDQGLPAVEPLALQDDVEARFGPFPTCTCKRCEPCRRFRGFKMWFGRVVREVMEARGYRHAVYDVLIDGKVFTYGSRYEKV